MWPVLRSEPSEACPTIHGSQIAAQLDTGPAAGTSFGRRRKPKREADYGQAPLPPGVHSQALISLAQRPAPARLSPHARFLTAFLPKGASSAHRYTFSPHDWKGRWCCEKDGKEGAREGSQRSRKRDLKWRLIDVGRLRTLKNTQFCFDLARAVVCWPSSSSSEGNKSEARY